MIAARSGSQKKTGARRRNGFVQEAVDNALGDESGNRTFLVATTRAKKNQFGKL